MTVRLKIPPPEEMISEMKKKGITGYTIHTNTSVPKSVVYTYLNGGRISIRSLSQMTEFVNNYKPNKKKK